tara:strand:- start:62 stop:400 length:339 start_codon:yes stop_codon:yes gene_type:complete
MSFEHKIGAPYEELSTVKVVGNNVLLLHTITASEDAVKYDSNWRIKTFDSFRKKVTNVAEDYTGGFDQDEILINDPIIMDILDENGEHDPISGVLVNFSAIIPTNINRKELN